MSQTCRIALKLDLKWPCERHTDLCGGARYANEHDWKIEVAMALLPAYRTRGSCANFFEG